MPTYPVFAQNPDVVGFKEEPLVDPTIRSDMESGDVTTRARFTGVPLKWSWRYSQFSNANKLTLATFERETVKYGADTFTWTHPITEESHEVRFADIVKYDLANSIANEWDIQVFIVQANVGS